MKPCLFIMPLLLIAGAPAATTLQTAPSSKPAARDETGPWIALYADARWYKERKAPEETFSGTLERIDEQEPITLMRHHAYRLGSRTLYPGRKQPELEKLVGFHVEIRGKQYDTLLEGEPLHEIWLGAIRRTAAPTQKSE